MVGGRFVSRTHDERTHDVLFAERRYEFFYWYISTMRGKEGGPLCEAGNCVRWADLSEMFTIRIRASSVRRVGSRCGRVVRWWTVLLL